MNSGDVPETNANISPISITIGGSNSRPFKSIKSLSWENIPPFAVLTGLNGSGKTQLLEFLGYRLSGINNHPQAGNLASTQLSIAGDKFDIDDVAFVPNSGAFSGGIVLNLPQMHQIRHSIYGETRRQHNIGTNFVLQRRRARIEKLFQVTDVSQISLDEFLERLIDRDENNSSSKRTSVISRYNIENYLLDPFVVFGILLSRGTAPSISDIEVSQGDEHRLRMLGKTQMQSIVRTIQGLVEPYLGQLSQSDIQEEKATFTNGVSLEYPGWMINRDGHSLLPIYQKIFGGVGVISPPRLMESFARVRLVPIELASIMASIQN